MKKSFHTILKKTWEAERDVEYVDLTMSMILGIGYLILQGFSLFALGKNCGWYCCFGGVAQGDLPQ